MSEPVTEAPPVEPAQAQPTENQNPPKWDDVFKGEDPLKVREALDNSRKWEARAKNSRPADYAELQRKAKEHDAAVEAARTDAEKAVVAARKEGHDEALKTGNSRLIQAEIRALAAAQGFRDPHDAIAQLRDKLGDVQVTDDGVDADALKAALTELATAKPYLLNDGRSPGPIPDPGQGARTNSPEALSQAEYERYYPPTNRK